MASGPITSRQIVGKQWKQWLTLFFWAPKSLQMVTAAMKLKDAFSWKKSYDQLSILKSRDIMLPTKVHLVKAMVFPVVMYGCESWTINKAKCWRIDAFELWCWRTLLGVPWTARKTNQSILKESSPEYSLEGLMLNLKLQYCGHLMWRTDWFEEILMLDKTEGGRRRWLQRMRWLDRITDSRTGLWANSGSWWWTGKPGVLQSVGSQRVGHDWATELNWTLPRSYPFLAFKDRILGVSESWQGVGCACVWCTLVPGKTCSLSGLSRSPRLSS